MDAFLHSALLLRTVIALRNATDRLSSPMAIVLNIWKAVIARFADIGQWWHHKEQGGDGSNDSRHLVGLKDGNAPRYRLILRVYRLSDEALSFVTAEPARLRLSLLWPSPATHTAALPLLVDLQGVKPHFDAMQMQDHRFWRLTHAGQLLTGF